MGWRSVIFCLAILTGVLAGSYATPAAKQLPATMSPTTSGEAAAVLSAAREALGGDKRLSAVKTVVAGGQTRQLQGDNLVPILFEISIELPEQVRLYGRNPGARKWSQQPWLQRRRPDSIG